MASTTRDAASAIGITSVRVLLAPTTALYALPFGAYYLLLSYRVVAQRLATNTLLGNTTSTAPSASAPPSKTEGTVTAPANPTSDPLYIAIRAQENFLETAPMGLLFALTAELNGADRRGVAWALAGLLAMRVAHVELGLRRKGAMGLGRLIGYWGTQAWLAGVAAWCGALVKDYWMPAVDRV
ncbi:MAPEG family-domain-containing protein [Geopyxis carbonaria]|nr:MAPEG family-domain-containing protein [Geopyxis carbonaria]